MAPDRLPQPQLPVQRPSFLVQIIHGKAEDVTFNAHYCSELDWDPETRELETDVFQFGDVLWFSMLTGENRNVLADINAKITSVKNGRTQNDWFKEEKSIPQAG